MDGPTAAPSRSRLLVLDGMGLLLLAICVALIAYTFRNVRAHDVWVYHLAARHLAADDLYQHFYPGPSEPYTYPPSALLILYPLTEPDSARVIIFVATLASIWVTLWLVVRACGPDTEWMRPGGIAVLSALMLLSLPMFIGAGLGQAAPVVMGLAAIATLGRPSRWNGVILGTATAIKLTPAAFALYWWIAGRRRAALAAGLTFLAWAGIAAIVMPRSTWWYFGLGGVMKADQGYSNISNQALTGVATRVGFYDSPVSRLSVLAVSAVLLIVALLVARRVHQAGWTAAAVCLVGVWSGIASPLAWLHAFGWWIPLAVAIALHGRTRSDLVMAVLMYLAPTFMVLGPFPPLASIGYTLPGLLVTSWLCWRVRSSMGSGRPHVQTSATGP